MVRLESLDETFASHLRAIECSEYDTRPWVNGPPLNQRRVALISTAGLHRREDTPFLVQTDSAGDWPADYRVIPSDSQAEDLVMSHVSTNFDRTGFQQDWNVVFPLDRLRELAQSNVIGSLADYHYSFMGAVTPQRMEPSARKLAPILKADNVDLVMLVPV
ncbi:MAG: glycine/sarcosine/betaine reductase selenoprotein B family protein [Dehalococcoidia bacterium]|jgi:D-proline reductase (dithiol) PrdB|nr:glycine/sarcosine/betaine reductase selenoprotein B family protein [Dehalococcoidia bacterium]